MIQCRQCGLSKLADDFFPSNLTKGGMRFCRSCSREYRQRLAAKHRQNRPPSPPPINPRRTPFWRPASERPTLRDLAWVAGFLEGEGSFGKQYGQVYATQKDPECLYRLQRYFGGSVSHRTRHMRTGGTNDVHDWRTYGPVAFGLMLTIYPFMSTRRKAQIRTVIQSVQARRAAAVANRKIWRWECDPTGKRRYVDVTHRVQVSRAPEARSGQPGLFDSNGHP